MRYLTALRQHAVAYTVRIDHDLLIVSPGGVGTTFMLEFFGKHLRCNHPHDKDYLKHLPCPPKRYSPSTRFLYIYGDPIAAALSLERRKMLSYQAMKNGSFAWDPPNTVAALLETGRDAIRFEPSFAAWSQFCQDNAQVRMQDYASIWEELPEIFSFLGLPDALIADFPPMRSRVAAAASLDPAAIARLRKIFHYYYASDQ